MYGATGFVGRQTVRYLASNVSAGPVRWAIAGRDRAKLERVRAEAGPAAAGADLVIADSRDRGAVAAMARSARVLMSTAGPFGLYGDAVVDACVAARTHYCDITGETAWVSRVIERHHAQAAFEETRIVPFCGFDSVPSDLGAHLLVQHIERDLGTVCVSIKAYFQLAGGFGGGTIASVINTFERGDTALTANPFLLAGPHSARDVERNQDVRTACFDPDAGTWVGPYFMAPVNTRVVRRSAALRDQIENFSGEFDYQEYHRFDPPLARLKAVTMTGMLMAQGAVMASRTGRRLLQAVMPAPGEGPSGRTKASGWFTAEFLARTQDGREVWARVADQGDPSNRVTTKCVCEAALALALDTDHLPGGALRGGVLTPATALGEVLICRLRQAGMTIQLVPSFPRAATGRIRAHAG
jgi:short subunit dehydrogenase-like uncharacterized protein